VSERSSQSTRAKYYNGIIVNILSGYTMAYMPWIDKTPQNCQFAGTDPRRQSTDDVTQSVLKLRTSRRVEFNARMAKSQ
jgi:hypothetical protein